MIAVSIDTRYNGSPLEVLCKLIEKRRQFCYECARDAVLATAITALQSIRALTKNARARKRFTANVTDTGYFGGYSATEHRRVVRQGISRHSPKINLGKVVFTRATYGARQYLQHIYRVVPEHEKDQPYYVCCFSQKDAENYEIARVKRRIKSTGGLARNVLSIAMMRCSSGNAPALEGGGPARRISETVASVSKHESGNEFAVDVVDALEYAVAALTGPIDLALQRAANKVSGLIRHSVHLPLGADVPTPFPEIVRSR